MKQITIVLVFLLCHTIIVFGQDFNYFFKTIPSDTANLGAFASIPIHDGYLVTGPQTTIDSKLIFLQKLDVDGNTEWAKVLDEAGLEDEISMNTGSLLISLKDNFLLTYNKPSENNTTDIGIINFDNRGQILWEIQYGDGRFQAPHILLGTKDGGFIVGGFEDNIPGVPPFQFWTMYVVKADSLGNQEWEQRYTLDEGNSSLTVDIIETLDGGYLLGGYGHLEEDFPGAYQREGYIVKIDSLGNTEWEKNYGTLDWDDSGIGVYQYPDSTYLLYSSEGASESMFNYLMFRHIDQDGNTLEENTYEEWYTGPTSRFFPLEDGGFLGFANHHFKENDRVRPRLMRFMPYCRDTLWTKIIDYLPEEEGLGIRDVDATDDGGFIITGFRYSPFPQFGWVLKIDSLGNGCFEFGCDSTFTTNIEPIESVELQNVFTLFPNPTKGEVQVQFSEALEEWKLEESEFVIRDVSGRVLKVIGGEENGSFENSCFLDVSDLESGVYFVDWQLEGKSLGVKKLVLY